jgi:predicted HD superfamily hydrolase involved in NAD metabolism
MYTASCLAMRYGSDMEQAMLAGLLHDCAKCLPGEKQIALCKKHHIPMRRVEEENPFLLHAKLGAFLAKKNYHVEDAKVLHAIEVHTTGEPAMNQLDKIIFIADYIEPNRDKAPNLPEIRRLAFEDLDRAVLHILDDTLHFLNTKKGAIDERSHETYEYYRKLFNEG